MVEIGAERIGLEALTVIRLKFDTLELPAVVTVVTIKIIAH